MPTISSGELEDCHYSAPNCTTARNRYDPIMECIGCNPQLVKRMSHVAVILFRMSFESHATKHPRSERNS